MPTEKTEFVRHEDLFDTTGLSFDVGTPKPGAKERLDAMRAAGTRIVVSGPIADTRWGVRALTAAMYDNHLPFDEIDETSSWRSAN